MYKVIKGNTLYEGEDKIEAFLCIADNRESEMYIDDKCIYDGNSDNFKELCYVLGLAKRND